jgi:molecular chaperone GrpE
MSESFSDFGSPPAPAGDKAAIEEPASGQLAPSDFGLVDVIEAFTAMRHEWRGQTRESRELAESIKATAASLQELQKTLIEQAASASSDDGEELAKVIVDVDSQLTRAIGVVVAAEAGRIERIERDRKAIEDFFGQMNFFARKVARPLMVFATRRLSDAGATESGTATEGLKMLLSRLRRRMKEQQIERLDAVGRLFDPEEMNAIDSVPAVDCPAGQVVEQMSPGYRWRGRLLRFADVRVAR